MVTAKGLFRIRPLSSGGRHWKAAELQAFLEERSLLKSERGQLLLQLGEAEQGLLILCSRCRE